MSALEQLREDIASAKKTALEGVPIEVFDVHRNRFKTLFKPDLMAYTRLLELEAKIIIALEIESGNGPDGGTVDVGADELREILEGMQRNGATESKQPAHR